MDDSKIGCIGLVIVALFFGFVAFLVGVTDEPTANRILASDGVTHIQFTGYDWFACGESDWYHTGFRGVKNGQTVNGVVCSGLLFKASTVRYH